MLAQLPDFSTSPPRVLDLGCGRAASAYPIRDRWSGAVIVGLDYDWPALQAAPDFVYRLFADLRDWPLRANGFDLIVIRHPDVFRHPNRWQQAIDGSYRLLRAGGCLLVTCYSLPEVSRLRDMFGQVWALAPSASTIRFDFAKLSVPDVIDHDRYAFAWQIAPILIQ